jgi:nucleotide-binding universal stress UspA family protein
MAEVRYCIATDGSQISLDAFQVRLTQMVRDDLMQPNDHIIVVHIFDNSKAYLLPELRSDYIYRTTESQLLPYVSPSKYSLYWMPRDPSKSTRQQLVETAQLQNASIMVVGFHGRRGPKQDATVMGSAVDHSLQFGTFNLLIVKNQLHRTSIPDGSFNWIVLTDGSEKAEKGLRTVAAMARRDIDKVYVIHGRTSPDETLKPQYEALISSSGVRGTYLDLDIKRSTFTEELIEFLNCWEVRVDFTVLGAYGRTASSLGASLRVGSVAHDIIKYVKTNLLIIK